MSNPKTSSTPLTIFDLIHDLHKTITTAIDSSLSWDTLNSPPVDYSLVRPIVERFRFGDKEQRGSGSSESKSKLGEGRRDYETSGDRGETGNVSRNEGGVEEGVGLGGLLYALMVNRIRFMSLARQDLSWAPLQCSRAAFCELLAMKLLRTVSHKEDEAELVGELVRGWCPFDGAPEEVWASMGTEADDVKETTGSALELAIVSTSKHFLSLPLIQHLINEIYLGHLVYSPLASRALISDMYKEDLAEVYVYDPFTAGWLDHQRLRVPKWRWWLEFGSFVVLLVLFVTTLSLKDMSKLGVAEVMFMVFALGFALDEFATSKEHGWTVYAANAWNAFDMTFIAIFFVYFVIRIVALASRSPNTSDLAFDILAIGACILFPRLVFFLIKDNVVILALRAMISRFLSFMGLTILAFTGIGFCLWTLARGTWSVRQIIWLMLLIAECSLDLVDLTGFSSSESFHPIFGPIVLIGYAALCNVLLITILIAILSNKFAEIHGNAQEEHLFQRVVTTVEGVKSDAVFSYYPPVNLLAFFFLVPLSWTCSPRTLHRINVFAIRVTNFPILIAISAYERWKYRSIHKPVHLRGSTFDSLQRTGLFDSIIGGGSEVLIESVFQVEPLADEPVTPPRSRSVVSSDAVEESLPDFRRQSRGMAFDSPLAKLFGTRNPSPPRPSIADTLASKSEVESLQAELKDVRASQLRMEELLSKVLAGGIK
ncbi:hypothetical protein M231_04141 [Tremella mesenterica]|uniref:Uncharacterized protein n=1 Tax=Tremella mesenterica TaxID=5217 RepID=A0A4Q1BLG8_TREME|nr:hypothetical protein M231_04141 [Tremella mesenterica]